MRDRLIHWLERLLAWMGHEVSVHLIRTRAELQVTRLECERVQAEASARRARQAILHEAINGLWDEAVRLDLVKQGNAFKRNQLYATAKKRFPKISDDLCALSAAYALYYVHQENAKADRTLTPSREDV